MHPNELAKILVNSSFLSDLDRLVAVVGSGGQRRTAGGPAMPADLVGLGQLLDEATARARGRAHRLVVAEKDNHPDSPLFGAVSLFEATGHVRYETAHTQSLAWLLNPHRSHGFDDTLFDEFLSAIDCSVHPELDSIRCRIRDERRGRPVVHTEYPINEARADVFAEGRLVNGEGWSLVIELKVDAVESEGQLDKYHRKGANSLHVFLTPSGRDGTTHGRRRPWATMSFMDLVRAFVRPRLTDQNKHPGAPFLRMYLTGLLNSVCDMVCVPESGRVETRNSPYKLEQLLGPLHVHID